jgi:uncharacterized membrane protein
MACQLRSCECCGKSTPGHAGPSASAAQPTTSVQAAGIIERACRPGESPDGRGTTVVAMVSAAVRTPTTVQSNIRRIIPMASVEKSIEVEVPVNTAYNQWTQFEDFPRFMEGVKEVRQLDDARLQWRADIAGKEEQWEAEITSQVPDERVAWRSISGAENAGIVTFHPVDNGRTRVDLRIEYETDGIIEKIGDALGAVSSRVEGDL